MVPTMTSMPLPKKKRLVKRIVVHCSASPDTMDIGAAEIRSWHIQDNGWSDIGYHAVVRRSGLVEPGRPEAQIGAHTKGFNANSLGVCWVGRDLPEGPQYAALVEQIVDWCTEYAVTPENVVGHRELAPLSGKTCPNLQMDVLRLAVKKRLKAPH